jgi:TM2 domain-containing membrane protein YozV
VQGTILGWDVVGRTGAIAGAEGRRYQFTSDAWKANLPPAPGLCVDFVAEGDIATQIYLTAASAEKSRVTAGVLGILLGSLGVHKFYLGYNGPGVVMLLITLIGIPLTVVLIGGFMIGAMTIIGLIEGIIYLTKTDAEFANTYVAGRKGWF